MYYSARCKGPHVYSEEKEINDRVAKMLERDHCCYNNNDNNQQKLPKLAKVITKPKQK